MDEDDLSSGKREQECARLVETIWSNIIRGERAYGKSEYFYDVLLLLLGKEVAHCRIEIHPDSFEGIPPFITKQIIDFFLDDVRGPIRAFEKDKEEGDDLFIQLLTNAEAPLAVAHRTAARRRRRDTLQQMHQEKPPGKQQG